MKICIYIFDRYAKANYKKECFDTRLFAGLMVIKHVLESNGHKVEFASKVNVHKFDIVLVSLTSDCDWWAFISERTKWKNGRYKVVAGGPGVLNVRPFLEYADYFVLGRAENVICDLVLKIMSGDCNYSDCVIFSEKFDINKNYYINQSNTPYPHQITIGRGKKYKEGRIGCNHKCLFCGYTWHRKNTGGEFVYDDLYSKNKYVELAIIDVLKKENIDYSRVRTTAIDGLSERLRFIYNKKITREMVQDYVYNLATCSKPHQVKFYNIIGYPSEDKKDQCEFIDDVKKVDSKLPKTSKQTCILLHSTPFRATPATPVSCEPMSYKNYRKYMANEFGSKLKGNLIYQGNSIWMVESMGTESLSTVILSALVIRGTEKDKDLIKKIALSKKFWRSSNNLKINTIESNMDVKRLFKRYSFDELPTKNIKTYIDLERYYGQSRT